MSTDVRFPGILPDRLGEASSTCDWSGGGGGADGIAGDAVSVFSFGGSAAFSKIGGAGGFRLYRLLMIPCIFIILS